MITIVVSATAPGLAVALLIGTQVARLASSQMEGEVLRAAEHLVHQQQALIKNAEQMLRTLAVTNSVLAGDMTRTEAFLKRLYRENRQFATILATDNDGRVVASSLSVDTYGIADREYVQEALGRRAFTVGPYLISRSTGLPIIPLALPILNDEGDARYLLVAALTVSHIRETLSSIPLPDDAVVELTDRLGVRLVRYPEDPRYPVGGFRDETLWPRVAGGRSKEAGKLVLAMDIPVGTYNDPSFRVAISVPLSAASRRGSSSPYQILVIGGLAVALSVMLAMALYDRSIGRRFALLLDQAAALGDQEGERLRPAADGEDELDLLRRTLADSSEDLYRRDKEQREAAEAIAASLREKEVLLKEIHHRVKNNFQIISSLMSLQTMTTEDPKLSAVLEESKNRIQSMAIIHERLYRSDDFSRIDFGEYACAMAEQVALTYRRSGGAVRVAVRAGQAPLALDAAIPLGLILNELLSNCFKHAYAQDSEGTIRVVLEAAECARAVLAVEDDGVGLPEDFALRKEQSLGMTLIRTLSEQVGGSLSLESPCSRTGRGTRMTVSFPLPEGFRWTPAPEEAIITA